MATSRKKRKKSKPYYDYNLIAVILLLMCFGLIMLYSTSAYVASIQFNDDMYYFRKQAIISIASLLWAFVISRVDYHIYTKFPTLIYLAAAFLMFLVRTPLGVTVNGAKRWLKIGPLQFQPSELAKLAIILCLPYLIVKMGRKIATKKGFALIFIIGMMLGAMTFFFTDNLSTAVIVCGITAGMIFIAHPRTKEFLIALGIFAGVCAIGLSVLIANLQNSNNFRLQRILVWLHPEDYIKSDGYQIMQALYAIGSGGFLGKGLGNSVQKLGWVPEAQNDMIFSIICEELGLFGAGMIVLLFLVLIWRFFVIATHAKDLLGCLIASGAMAHMMIQVILNIAVVTNSIPNTGITLPFISYGGTSVLFLLLEMGLVLSVSNMVK